VGQLSTGLLLAQDVAVIPMLLVLNLVGGETPATGELVAQGVGVVLLGGIAVWSVGRRKGPLPLRRWVQGDRELELFAAFLVGLTLALVSGALGLSTVLGAFVAGVAMQAVDDRVWIAHRLEPFHDLLVGAFFLAVGAQIDLGFLWEHLSVVVGLVVGAVLLKTLINALIFGAAGLGWREAVVGGALMSPIGEFSLVLAGVGLQAGLIQTWGYQLTLAIISLSLIVAPVYGSVMRRRGSEA
jgi:CPA2 family monovalent cation:H+ antiporter-2